MSETKYLDDTGTPYVSYKLDDDGNLLEGVRADGYVDVMIDFTEDELATIQRAADQSGITVNELITQAIEAELGVVDDHSLT